MAIRAPAKAAATIIHEETKDTNRSATIMTRATKSFDPEEMPRTKGPAMGFWKNVCMRKPDRARPPPSTAEAMILGSRSFQTMFIWVLSPSRRKRIRAISPTEIFTLPELMFHTVSTAKAKSRPTKTARYLARLAARLLSADLPIAFSFTFTASARSIPDPSYPPRR